MKRIVLVIVWSIVGFCVKAQNLPYCFNTPPANLTPTIGAGAQPVIAISNDFNNDGKIDIVTLNQGSNNFSVLLGTGVGSFATVVNYSLSPYTGPNSLVSSDFNGDGNLDLAITFTSIDSISIYMGSGSGSFSKTNSYAVGSQPNAIITDDFNGDGIIDLAIGNYNSVNISILLGTGAGTFTTATNYLAGTYPKDIKTGDYNGDGIKDIVAVGLNGSDLSILLGTGNGAFAAYFNYTLGFMPDGMKTGDFNGDGKADLALIKNNNAGPLYYFQILIGTGNSSFFLPPVTYTVGFNISSLYIGDYTGDGIVDIAAVIAGSYTSTWYVSMFVGSGLGTFGNPINYNLSFTPGKASIADYNNDGKLDLAIINNTSYMSLSVLLGLGNGHFSTIDTYATGPDPRSLTSADFNGDGIPDLVSANYNSQTVSLLLGSGSGSFLAATSYTVGNNPSSIVSADFNNDGSMDIATANGGSNSTSILLGSGIGTFTSTINYAAGNLPVSITAGDFNKDGNIDIASTNYSSHNISIRLGTGVGTFSSIVNYSVSFAPTSIVNGDFNGDNNLDLVLADDNSNIITTFLGSSTGTFVSSYNSNSFYGTSSSLLAKDFNSDNILDLALSHSGIDSVSILLGTGSGSFTTNNNYKVGGFSESITAGDFNGDGILDLATGINNSLNVSILMGIGFGNFAPVINFKEDNSSFAILASDFNGDGKIDLAMSNTGSNTISILINGIPTVSVTGVNTLCLSNNATITATGATTYSWSSGSTTNSIVVSPSSTNTYTVTGASLYGCVNTAIKTITVNALPIPTISINSGSICSGSNYTLTPSGGITYTYSSGSATVSPNISSTYTVFGSDALGCYGTAISSITVSPSPTLSVNSGSLCVGDSFTISPTGAMSYTYSSINPIITPSVTNTYTITGEDAFGCIGSGISSITVNSLPTLAITSTNTVCINSSATISASGASTYTWNTGATTTSISVTPTITTTYSVIGTNTLSCNKTETISVTVDNTCADVWPGDANSDGVADNLDVLELGLHYTQTGTPRATISNLWQSYYSANWSGTITNGKNLNHSNCNGDGIINDDDTLAIYTNYSLTHAFKPEQTTTSPLLTIVPDQSAVAKGTWGSASINLGNVTTPISNINGIAYTVNYDNTLLETDSIWIDYSTSFINVSNLNLNFRKRNFTNGKLFTATTHTTSGNVNGYGKIATLHYKIKSTLATDNVLNLSVSQANQSNASGAITPLTAGSATLMAIGASVGINELTDGNYLSILPNPANDILLIELNTTNDINATIEMTNTLGQVVLSSSLKNNKEILNITHLSNGVYFVKVLSINKQIGFKKIVVQR